jgi:hypothetical protein
MSSQNFHLNLSAGNLRYSLESYLVVPNMEDDNQYSALSAFPATKHILSINIICEEKIRQSKLSHFCIV